VLVLVLLVLLLQLVLWLVLWLVVDQELALMTMTMMTILTAVVGQSMWDLTMRLSQ
jgi:hypothetical protein